MVNSLGVKRNEVVVLKVIVIKNQNLKHKDILDTPRICLWSQRIVPLGRLRISLAGSMVTIPCFLDDGQLPSRRGSGKGNAQHSEIVA